MSATIRENLLVSMGMYAGNMMQCGAIKLPYGTAGEDALADFCVECVDNFIEHDNNVGQIRGMDIPFDDYAIECLASKFGIKDDEIDDDDDEDDTEFVTDGWVPPTHRVLACAGRVEKQLFEGSYEQCEQFCDYYEWIWQPDIDGFVWDLEVEEI